jgi:predicted PurR-regulated permease PerM
MKSSSEEPLPSPRWSNSAKLLAAIVFIGISVLVIIRFQYMIAPLLAAFLLAYILQPAAAFLNRKFRISWKFSVSIIYVIFLILLVSLLIWGGSEIIRQTVNLIQFLINTVKNLPQAITNFFSQTIMIGSLKVDLSKVDISTFQTDITNFVTNTIPKLTNTITNIGSQAFSFFGWAFFSIFISYFLLHETSSFSDRMIAVNIPQYRGDMKKLGLELDKVWNAFLRRQLLIFLLATAYYSAILGLLQVNGFFWLALLCAFARYVPYLGPIVAWSAIGLVAYFQGTTIFGLSSVGFLILVLVIIYIADNIFDVFFVTRMMSDALQLHPAATMLAAFLMLNWLGLIGMILSAPILASLILIVKYLWYKYNDEDPWEHIKLLPHKPRERNIYKWSKSLFKKVSASLKRAFNRRQKTALQRITKNKRDETHRNEKSKRRRNAHDRTENK